MIYLRTTFILFFIQLNHTLPQSAFNSFWKLSGPEKSWVLFRDHPQLQARNRWRTVDSPAGPLPALLPPVILPDCEAVMGAIPALGEHSESILRELGYAEEWIQQLRTEGAV